MKKPRSRFALLLLFSSLLSVQPAVAGVTSVNCDDPKKNSINAALALLNPAVPNTLQVSGTCNEDVVVVSFQRLTMAGNPAATIHGSLQAIDSPGFTIRDFTVTATGSLALVCGIDSTCFLTNVTVEDATSVGFFVTDRSKATLNGGTIRNNPGRGVLVIGASELTLLGGVIENNGASGIVVEEHSFLNAGLGSSLISPVIHNNVGNGIRAAVNSTVRISSSTVSGNGLDGLRLETGSVGRLENSSITGNTGHGIRIGDQSLAWFRTATTVSGNNPDQVTCDGQFAVTRGFANATGATTNCSAEPAPLP
ncbi:MAG TPA: right-handed parallel beta-helix repeat-containing protein [Terriglobales bacterium]|nr:right-handed parallel beta-helix repeat-containing protein [Terriglobales bacterium]